MRFILICFYFACFSLSACATLPEIAEEHVETADVVRNIKCELRDAAFAREFPHEWLHDWNAVVSLTMLVNHKGGVVADASLTHPLTPGQFLLPISGTVSGEASRTEKIVFKERLAKLRLDDKLLCASGDRVSGRPLLGGYLGIADLLDRGATAATEGRIVPSSLDYTLNFKVVRSANIGPRFSLIPIGGDLLTAGLRLEGNRDQSHTLNIVLQKNPDPCPFPEVQKKFNGHCPTFVMNYPATVIVGKDGNRIMRLPGESEGFEEVVPSRPAPAPANGVSRDASDSLDRALTRSILQDTLDELRQRGLNTP